MGHVEAEGDAFGQHLVNAGNHVGSRTGFVVGSPLVEPAAPEFGAHQRAIRTEFLQRCKLLVDVGSCTEVHGPYQVVESVLGEVGRPVALEQCYAGVVGAYDVADLRYVAFVFPVGAVFVLYLYHDDGTSVLYGHTSYLLGNGFFEDTYTLHKVGVGFAQADIFFLE